MKKLEAILTNWYIFSLLPGVAVVDGKLYVVGGWSGQTGFAKCEVYDPELKKWSPIAPLKTGNKLL